MIKKRFALFLVVLVFLSGHVLFPKEIFEIPVGRNFIIDSNGNMYTDRGSSAILKYSSKSEELLVIGRSGSGPSDIKRLGQYEINPKTSTLYVTEFFGGNKWISIFALETGKFLGTWGCEFDWKNWDGLSVIKFDVEGNVYFEAIKSNSRKYRSFVISTDKRTIFKFSPTGRKLKEIHTLDADFDATQPGKGNITIPFFNYLYWTIYGNHIFVRESCSPDVLVYDLNGILKRKIRLPFNRELVTDKDIEDWEKWLRENEEMKKSIKAGYLDLDYWKKELPFPKYRPVSGGKLFTDGKGYIYSKKNSGYLEKNNLWAKIDTRTGKVELVKFPVGRRLILTKDSCFYFQEESDEDEITVVKINENEDGLFAK